MSKQEIFNQIDSALAQWNTVEKRVNKHSWRDLPLPDLVSLLNILHNTIYRLAPPGSSYKRLSDSALKSHGLDSAYSLQILVGVLKAIRSHYESGNLFSVGEAFRAEVFSDFIEMATHLLKEGYKDAAAVIAGGVLEGHLRKLCEKLDVSTRERGKKKKADRLNADLTKAEAYSMLDQKNVTAWLDLRNHAAHAEYGLYTKEQVALMIQGITDFIARCPA